MFPRVSPQNLPPPLPPLLIRAPPSSGPRPWPLTLTQSPQSCVSHQPPRTQPSPAFTPVPSHQHTHLPMNCLQSLWQLPAPSPSPFSQMDTPQLTCDHIRS